MDRFILSEAYAAIRSLPWQLSHAFGLYSPKQERVQFVIEKEDWAIRWEGEHIRDKINNFYPKMVGVTLHPESISNSLVHFGSQYMWVKWWRHLSRTNNFVTSYFHGKHEDGDDVARHIDRFLISVPRLKKVVTAASMIETRLIELGVPRDKLVRIPIGVDTKVFVPPNLEQRAQSRSYLNIDDGMFVVGSFQKDGEGWGEGLTPKLIKGPDIFVEALRAMKSMGIPVMALLTGPSRGYVKSELSRAGIPFVHKFINHHKDLVNCYHALDIYIIASREEGGPKALMESMASGVPVVSTRVGMAPDLIVNGINGFLADNFIGEELAMKACQVMSLGGKELSRVKLAAGLAVKVADWSIVGRSHWEKVYQPLLEQR